jgi:hypothetical protein
MAAVGVVLAAQAAGARPPEAVAQFRRVDRTRQADAAARGNVSRSR